VTLRVGQRRRDLRQEATRLPELLPSDLEAGIRGWRIGVVELTADSPVATGSPAAVAAYQKAVALDRANLPTVGIRLIYLMAPGGTAPGKDQMPTLEALLRDISRREPSNPLPAWVSALLMLESDSGAVSTTESATAATASNDTHPLAMVEQANTPSWRFRRYPEATPAELSAAWGYLGSDGFYLDRSGELLNALAQAVLARYAPTMGPLDADTVLRAISAVIAMARRAREAATGDTTGWLADQNSLNNYGVSMEQDALRRLIAYYTAIGDGAKSAAANAQLDKLTESSRQFTSQRMSSGVFGYGKY